MTRRANTISIDGVEYLWEQRHGWVVERDRGIKGVSVSVWRTPGKTRELIVDFPFIVFGLDREPGNTKLTLALESAIRSAMHAGWDPESRGKAFRHLVPATK